MQPGKFYHRFLFCQPAITIESIYQCLWPDDFHTVEIVRVFMYICIAAFGECSRSKGVSLRAEAIKMIEGKKR